eukprot:scaffold638_cov168-Amphora_coffeaeformis.AAC.19
MTEGSFAFVHFTKGLCLRATAINRTGLVSSLAISNESISKIVPHPKPDQQRYYPNERGVPTNALDKNLQSSLPYEKRYA